MPIIYYTANRALTQALKNSDHIYLSPHLDDAVLSCGGHIWQQVQAGADVLVVTIFAGADVSGAPHSSFAQQLHARWGHPADAVASRQEEDRAALALLGAEGVHWPYVDCIYRQTADSRFLYASEEALWGQVHPLEQGLIAELAARLATIPLAPGGTVYAPLEAGHHVDHQIVRRAAEASGHALTYYEDFPYAQDPQALQAALTERHARSALVVLTKEALEAKIAAIACYRSQISTFWADVGTMAIATQTFAERTGDGRPAERYWKLSTYQGLS